MTRNDRSMIEANQANWDARVPVHAASAFYGLDGSRDAAYWPSRAAAHKKPPLANHGGVQLR